MTLPKTKTPNIGQGDQRRLCYNCKKEKLGALVPDPSSPDKDKMIWVCNDCYEDWYIK